MGRVRVRVRVRVGVGQSHGGWSIDILSFLLGFNPIRYGDTSVISTRSWVQILADTQEICISHMCMYTYIVYIHILFKHNQVLLTSIPTLFMFDYCQLNGSFERNSIFHYQCAMHHSSSVSNLFLEDFPSCIGESFLTQPNTNY